MKVRILIGITVGLFLCFASAWGQRPGDFRVIGPGGGGAMFNPTISPHDVNTVLVSCDMTGSYISHDGGRTWRMFNLRGVVNFFVFDPRDPKTMYAHATGLWRSRDGGETWHLVDPAPSTVRGVKMNSDHADETILAASDPLGEIYAMAIDPADSGDLYVAAGSRENPSLYVSRDSGKTWQKQAELTSGVRRIWVDPHSPQGARKLFLGGAKALTVATGSDVKNLSFPAPATDLALGFGSGAQPVVYVTSLKGAFVSTDGGENWRQCALPGNGAKVRATATSLHHPETAYLSYSDLALDGKTWLGVAKTENSGADWKLVWKESSGPASNVHDDWITPRFGIT